MKTRTIVAIAGIMLLIQGCGKTECDGYAPEGTEISWTAYNTVKQVHDYFSYLNTSNQHRTDTVMMWGYVIGKDDTNYFRSEYESARAEHNYFLLVFLCDDPTARLGDGRHAGRLSMNVYSYDDEMEWILDYRVGKRVFLKGFCYASDPTDDRGCHWLVDFNVISAFVE